MTHLLLEAHGTFGHCQEGHGLKKVTFDLCHNLSPLQKDKKLVAACLEAYVLGREYSLSKGGLSESLDEFRRQESYKLNFFFNVLFTLTESPS